MLRLFLVLSVALACLLCVASRASVLDWGYEFPDESSEFVEIHGDGIYTVADEKTADRQRSRLAKEIERRGLVDLARKSNLALSGLMKIGSMNLKRRGFHEEAKWLENGWREHDGEIERIVAREHRDIGDFEPLFLWLAMAYEVLEYKLGYGLCYTLRLTDIKSYNFGLIVTFNPCKFGLEEFMRHAWTGDPKYRSVVPMTTYWVTSITCSIGTFGAGYFFICSPIAMLVELGMNKAVAPWLGPKVYNLICN